MESEPADSYPLPSMNPLPMLESSLLLLVLVVPPQDPPAQPPEAEAQPPVEEVGETPTQEEDAGAPKTEPLRADEIVPDPQDPSIESPFGPDRPLELTVIAALEVAEMNNLGLRAEDIASDVARFSSSGSWGAFDWVFDASGRYTDFSNPQGLSPDGLILPDYEGEIESFDFSLVRPTEIGGSFSATFGSDKTTVPAADLKQTRTNLRLSYTQSLLRGFGKTYATSQQEEADVLYFKQLEHRREVLQALLSDVYNAYWELVRTRQQLDVAGVSLDLGVEQLERNQRMLEAGVGTEVEVIQAEAEVATRLETLLAAEKAVRDAGDALKILLFPGRDVATWETELIPVTPLPETVSAEDLAPWDQLLSVATEYRPELRQQRLEIEAAKIRHERAISQKKLGLDLDLSVLGQGVTTEWGDSSEKALRFDHPTYVAGLRFNAPITNRTARYAEKAARAQVRAAFIGYEQIETTVVGEVRNAVRQVRYTAEAVNAAVKSLEAARRQLAAEEARYRNDLSTNFQVLEYQLRLAEAMNTEQSTRVAYVKALYQLDAAQGILGEIHR